jgi:UV DNA damage endonuclease
MVNRTWRWKDGIPMVDYSSPRVQGRKGSHAESIDLRRFRRFVKETRNYDFDIMLEIKDKEKSAIKALELVQRDERFKKARRIPAPTRR